MARAPDPSNPYGNLANVDTEQESSKDHEYLQPFRPTTEERADLDTLSKPRASTRDLKDGDEPVSVKPASNENFEKLERSSLVDSPNIALHPRTSWNHDSGPCTTHDHHANIKRTFRTRNVACDPSNEFLEGIAPPLQRPTPVVTFGVQGDGHPSTLVLSMDLFSHEKLAMSSHRVHSPNAKNKPMLNTVTIKQERELFSGDMKIPRLVLPDIADIAIHLRNSTEVEDVSTNFDLEIESDKEKSSDTKSLRSSFHKLGTVIGQAEFAQMNAAAKNPSPLNHKSLAQKLDIDLSAIKSTCFGFTQKGPRCKNRISKLNWKHAYSILDRLTSLDPCSDAEICAEKLKLLACLIHCRHKHQGQAIDLAEAWEKSFSGSVQGTRDSNLPDRDVRSHTSILKVKQTLEVKHIPGAVNDLELSLKRKIDTNFGPRKDSGIKTIIRRFVPYNVIVKDEINKMNLVASVIKKDLSARDIAKDGFIYIYWFPVNFGHIKIGVTTRSPEERLREWKNQCGHEPELVYPTSPDNRQRVPHVFRVEAIVQAELQQSRRREVRCNGCYKAHKEWFEKSTPAAVTAVKKWSAWMRKKPYELNGRLKDERKQDLRNLSKVAPDAGDRSVSPYLRPGTRRPRSGSIDSRFRSHSEQPRRRSPRFLDDKRRLS